MTVIIPFQATARDSRGHRGRRVHPMTLLLNRGLLINQVYRLTIYQLVTIIIIMIITTTTIITTTVTVTNPAESFLATNPIVTLLLPLTLTTVDKV